MARTKKKELKHRNSFVRVMNERYPRGETFRPRSEKRKNNPKRSWRREWD